MNENVLLMRSAKRKLQGLWSDAVIASLIFLAIFSLLSSTTFLELVLAGPLMFGYTLFLACLIDRKESKLDLLFQGYQRFLETMLAGLIVSLIIGIGLIFLIFPGIIAFCGLSMTFFIMLDDPDISGWDAVKQSWNMMDGHKWNFFCLQLRFIGWALLAILTCGIGYIWLTPYMTVTNLNFYRKLRYGTY